MRMICKNVERIAETEAQAAALRAKGYRECSAAPNSVSEKTVVTDINEMNIRQLRVMAKERGVEGYESLGRNDLLSILKE